MLGTAFVFPFAPCTSTSTSTFSPSPHHRARLHIASPRVTAARLHLNIPKYSSSPSPQPPNSAACDGTSPTKICVSLTATSVSSLVTDACEAARLGADLVELRLDFLDPSELPNWQSVLPKIPLPVIVTNRPVWEGGRSHLEDNSRLSFLLDAAVRGVAHIDVELAALQNFKQLAESQAISFPREETKLIVSHHDFEKPLSSPQLTDIFNRMRDAGADICKVAMMAQSAQDSITVIDALSAADVPTICLAMGELGLVTRVAAARYGAYLTFATLDASAPAAPGQVALSTMIDLYGARSIKRDTPLFGIVGDPVSKSMSPAIHNAAIREKGLNGAYVHLLAHENFAEFVCELAKRGFQGFSVTMPAKLEVLKGMDELDSVTAQIGAMNTVVKHEDGSLKGYNTDWVAAISAVEEQFTDGLDGKVVVCIGAGGAGRALAFGALARGASHVIVVNRSKERAAELAKELGERATAMSLKEFNEGEVVKYDALLNSTSVGMKPDVDQTPVSKDRILPETVVFDAVYNPMRTRLLAEAEDRGCTTVSGLEMFLRQGVEQFRLWFREVEPPVELMRTVLLEKLGQPAR